jgi:hypothetical protein
MRHSQPGRVERGLERLARPGLIDQQVLAVGALRGEDLGPQDRREQVGVGLADRRAEERRDVVRVAERQLGLDERLGQLERHVVVVDDLVGRSRSDG